MRIPTRSSAAAALLVTGYLLGRTRPLEEARQRATFTIRFGRGDRRPLGMRHLAAWTVLHPVRGTRALWRAFGPGEEEPPEEPVSLDEVFAHMESED